MLLLVLSDLHMGKGKFFNNGQMNIMEDFVEDERLCEFLKFFSSDQYNKAPVNLVLNGDILNLIQIDVDGVFNHLIDEETTIMALEAVYDGHRDVFQALRNFINKANKKITYVIGNHDAGMAFPGAQERFKELVGERVEFCFKTEIAGVHIEHGHRFEAVNAVEREKYFVEGPSGRRILNLPWGSLFCIMIVPILKKERPFIDRVRPMSAYIKWCLFHDPIFFLRILFTVVKYFIATNLARYTRQNRNFKTTLKILKQITIFPKYGRKAKAILKKNRMLHTVVMGHTHLSEWRRFSEEKYYFNTGTWNTIASVDLSMHENAARLLYVSIEINKKTDKVHKISLNEWKGSWRPFKEDVAVNL